MENRTGFGPRLGAFLLDLVLIVIITIILSAVFSIGGMAAGAAAGAGDEFNQMAGATTGFMAGILAAMVVSYIVAAVWMLLEGFTGYTIGKLIVGIRIGNDDGTKAGTGKLLLRYAIKNSAFLLGILAVITSVGAIKIFGNVLGLIVIIGCFFVLGAKKQAFHDMIAKTAVYKKSVLK